MSYQKYKTTIKETNEARRAAIRVLIDNHREEFDSIYLEKARERGLNPTKIAAQVKKVELAKEKTDKFQADLQKILEVKEVSPEEISELTKEISQLVGEITP